MLLSKQEGMGDNMTARITIVKYMTGCINEHIDPTTNEVNKTSLCEDALSHFNEKQTEEDRYFDIAFTVAEQHEIKSGTKKGRFVLSNLINNLPSDYF